MKTKPYLLAHSFSPVIKLDSKPVKVSLDFDEKYLPFYCNLLTRSVSAPHHALAQVLKSHKRN